VKQSSVFLHHSVRCLATGVCLHHSVKCLSTFLSQVFNCVRRVRCLPSSLRQVSGYITLSGVLRYIIQSGVCLQHLVMCWLCGNSQVFVFITQYSSLSLFSSQVLTTSISQCMASPLSQISVTSHSRGYPTTSFSQISGNITQSGV
jgi:hypothetical protein